MHINVSANMRAVQYAGTYYRNQAFLTGIPRDTNGVILLADKPC